MKDKSGEAYCKVCKKELAAVVTALKKHSRTQYHKEKAHELYDPTLVRIDSVIP